MPIFNNAAACAHYPTYYDETLFMDSLNLIQFSIINVYNDADEFLVKRAGLKVHNLKVRQTNDEIAKISTAVKRVQQPMSPLKPLPLPKIQPHHPAEYRNLVRQLQVQNERLYQLQQQHNAVDLNKTFIASDGGTPAAVKACVRTVNVNPTNACYGINIYTMDATNKRVKTLVPFNRIIVVHLRDHTMPRPSLYVPMRPQNNPIDEQFKSKLQNVHAVPIQIADPDVRNVYTVNDKLTPLEMAIMLKYYSVNFEHVKITQHLYIVCKDYFHASRYWFINYKQYPNFINLPINDNSTIVAPNQIAPTAAAAPSSLSNQQLFANIKPLPVYRESRNIVLQNAEGEMTYRGHVVNAPKHLNIYGPKVDFK